MTSGIPASTPAPATDIVNRIITVLKRDLMLGADVTLAADTPLFNGELDLDSLDALMLVQSIEKEFNFKISSETFGPEVFKDVNSLAAVVTGQSPDQGITTLSPAILDALPHRPPFRFLTEVVSIDNGVSGEGHWLVTGEEPFFQGHFPDQPIVPGVLITEALAQLCGLVGFLDNAHTNNSSTRGGESSVQNKTATPSIGKLAHVDVRFRDSVIPPATIILHSRVERSLGTLIQFEVEALANERRIVTGKLSLALTTGEPDATS